MVKEDDKDANVVYIDKELEKLVSIQADSDLYVRIIAKLNQAKNNYIFIDEVQEIYNFQHMLRSLVSEGQNDIYSADSSASMLSGELARLLAGHYMESRIYTFFIMSFAISHYF